MAGGGMAAVRAMTPLVSMASALDNGMPPNHTADGLSLTVYLVEEGRGPGLLPRGTPVVCAIRTGIYALVTWAVRRRANRI